MMMKTINVYELKSMWLVLVDDQSVDGRFASEFPSFLFEEFYKMPRKYFCIGGCEVRKFRAAKVCNRSVILEMNAWCIANFQQAIPVFLSWKSHRLTNSHRS